ncbi:MAG TPA: hypothetical protein VEY51_15475, partial [Chondromyces sp.]|nr:hypothetical protein [Chondromyces sp.]
MVKRKRKSTRKKSQVKETLRYELIGLVVIALSIIGMIELGAVGKTFVYFFRFFLGEWYMIGLLATIGFAGYVMIKRQKPMYFRRRLVGIYIIIASLLLLSHVKLFELLANGGAFDNPSVITNTWELYWMDVRGQASSTDLGGGMAGALMFAVSYFLFDALGTKILAFLLIVIGFVLITGKSVGDFFGKILLGMRKGMGTQWNAFRQDMQNWKEERKSKQEQRKTEQKEKEVS